jgi:hypothetical protein
MCLVEEEPLIDGVEINSDSLNALYLGIGLCNSDELSHEMPFDVLSMLLSGEKLKRELGFLHNDVLIADEHAKTNGLDLSDIDTAAKYRRDLFWQIFDRLGLRDWNVHLASDICRKSDYMDTLREVSMSLPPGMHQYVAMELADMEWFRKNGTDVKLGWRSKGSKYDEEFFDRLYREHIDRPLTFIYTKPGRALNGNTFPPYLSTHEPNERLNLIRDEDIESKIRQMPKKTRRYFSQITQLFESLGYPLPDGSLAERLSAMYGVLL